MADSYDDRPDPQALLAQLRAQEAQARRGHLRIYFGASAGVGKTYAMLAAAHREIGEGRDVLVGVVETHGRADTARLLAGLPRLPLRDVAWRGRTLKEFDLDAALERKPAVAIVDELAHSNAPGSRHEKRWQDVHELLDAGIDVWSAINVQHLESLNGTVGAITGVRVHETVPDTVLDGADEVVLVDVTADELMARLAAGKVYLPQQAARAAQNFFRKGNLIALREMALRRTAEHVEDDVRHWRVEQSGVQRAAHGTGTVQSWHTSGVILACVGPDEEADQTVRTASRLASQLNVRWHVAYVETPRLAQLEQSQRDRILAVLKLAEDLGASTAVLAGSNVPAQIAAHALELNCATLLLGRSRAPPAWKGIANLIWPRLDGQIAHKVAEQMPAVDIVQVGRASRSRALAQKAKAPGHDDPARAHAWTDYLWTLAASTATCLLALPLAHVLDQANIVMLFLLAVVLVAVRLGRAPAAIAALLNVAAFDFFFVQPRFSFAVSDVQYLVTFAVMLGVGLLVGQMTAGLRFAARVATSREERAQALFDLTRELSGAVGSTLVLEIGAAAVRRSFGGEACVLPIDEHGRLHLPEPAPEGLDLAVADWVMRNNQSAGLATGTLSANAWHYVPLKAPMRLRGVLALRPDRPRWLRIPEQMRQLQTLARQVSIALERVHYAEVAQQALVEMESERLRNALLAAMSHDVRTPLTALVGLADTLTVAKPALSPAQLETAQAIAMQARALGALVTNLLDMARLQSGGVTLRSEWQSVEEVVGAAIRAALPSLGAQQVQTDIPADLPLVEFDAALIERVLVNLLENAARYGRAPIVISARVTDDALLLKVKDHGVGLPAALVGHEDQLFEKFTRGHAEDSAPGVGLGLAICKAVVDAHRGHIHAANAPGGGAEFTVTLARSAPPAHPEPADCPGQPPE